MNILGIETSCDETSAAVVQDGARILSNVIASQVDLHARFGGIVPEVASRQHVLQITPIIRRALEQAGLAFDRIDAVAVTAGPGLAGALLVGVNAAKAIAFARGVPLIGVNHLEAHIYANWLPAPSARPEPVEAGAGAGVSRGAENAPPKGPAFPLVCLIASGGHTDLVLMRGHGDYRVLGRTRDDAAGEAFDKAARLLGLGYPGGPLIQRIAEEATAPVPMPRAWLRGTHEFSFSGLKTAVLHLVQERGIAPEGAHGGTPQHGRPSAGDAGAGRGGTRPEVANIAAGFQEAVVEVLVEKTVEAAAEQDARCVLLAGGVAANKPLRARLVQRSPVPVVIPPPILCTDNAAMIACCGHYWLTRGERSGWDLDVRPNWKVGEG